MLGWPGVMQATTEVGGRYSIVYILHRPGVNRALFCFYASLRLWVWRPGSGSTTNRADCHQSNGEPKCSIANEPAAPANSAAIRAPQRTKRARDKILMIGSVIPLPCCVFAYAEVANKKAC